MRVKEELVITRVENSLEGRDEPKINLRASPRARLRYAFVLLRSERHFSLVRRSTMRDTIRRGLQLIAIQLR